MKILFVNHDVSHYGAATSLSLMLNNNPSIVFDMIVPDGTIDFKNEIIRRFNICNGRLFFFRLNIDWSCYVGGSEKKKKSFKWIKNIIYSFKDYLKFLFIIKYGNYDIVYINSLVLYRYVTKFTKCVIHIRERCNPDNLAAVLKYINRSAGVIFIDRATYMPFSNELSAQYEIINNPVDMTSLGSIENSGFFEDVDIVGKTVFSIIGQVTEEKGVFDVVRVFHEVRNPKSILFIAGNCDEVSMKKIQCLSKGDKRIVILGHCDSVDKLYNITDYVIRGEETQCVGRTTLEGLFAGCFVLAPGDGFWQEFDKTLADYKDNVFFYPPRDFSSLGELIKIRSQLVVSSRKYSTNVATHVEKLNVFLESIVS